MSATTRLACELKLRRKSLFGNPKWNGLDFLDVSEDQRSLCVHFFGAIPEGIRAANLRIEGGRRIRDLRVVDVEVDRSEDPERDDCLRVTVDRPGDFSVYRLCLVAAREDQGSSSSPSRGEPQDQETPVRRPFPGIDPRYSCLEFSFKTDCASDLDCAPQTSCPAAPAEAFAIDYLAKDYASFRQLIYDRMALGMPEWQERRVPDVGVALVELLAYVGDHLSYYQDAVATEAYLETARRRISVRRHARLVDYRMHEGNNARAWVTVCTTDDLSPLAADAFFFVTGFEGIPAHSGRVVRADDLANVPKDAYLVYEPVAADPTRAFEFRARHSEIRFYTWGDTECCLPAGATRATLLDQEGLEGEANSGPAPGTPGTPRTAGPRRILHLKKGDVLVFEEIVGPTTGNKADADPEHRHAVRLTRATPGIDLVLGCAILEIEWSAEDALPFALCLSARLPSPDCTHLEVVSVARGNVVLVDHGATVSEDFGPVGEEDVVGECSCDGAILEEARVPAAFEPVLGESPITFRESWSRRTPASRSIAQDPRRAVPAVSFDERITEKVLGSRWEPQPDLLESGSDDRHFVVEIDDEARAHVRFGDGDLGRRPAARTRWKATYRVGNGPSGNVGREAIQFLVQRSGTISAGSIQPRNPLPARGGRAAESLAEVRLLAPRAFRRVLERAVATEDYASIAEDLPDRTERIRRIQRAAAELCWTGSWYEARVAVDPLAEHEEDVDLLAETAGGLRRYRRMLHDLVVARGRRVPLDLEIDVCVRADVAAGAVRAALLDAFSTRTLPNGKRGFFHPDELTFGEGVEVSRIVAVAMAINGVVDARVVRLRRLEGSTRRPTSNADEKALEEGMLEMGALEIAQLDNDPSFPENGVLTLRAGGGR